MKFSCVYELSFGAACWKFHHWEKMITYFPDYKIELVSRDPYGGMEFSCFGGRVNFHNIRFHFSMVQFITRENFITSVGFFHLCTIHWS